MFILTKLEPLTPQLPPTPPNVRNYPSSTMEVGSFEEINAGMDNSPIQHYVSSLHGFLNAGEAVLLDEEVLLPANLRSKVATIIRKQDSPPGFIVNFYVFPRPNGIEVPRLPIPRKRTYVGFPAHEVIQTQYLSFVTELRFVALAYLIREIEILSGRKAFSIGMTDCFFLRYRATTTLELQPVEDCCVQLDCRSLTRQTWSIRAKLYRVIMEALNTKSLNSAYKRHKTIDFAEWEWRYLSRCFTDPPVEKKGFVTLRVNRLYRSKESCKVKTLKSSLQFTTTDGISKLQTILGSTITVSTRNGFPTAPKRLRAADDYLFSTQTAGDSDYVNAVLPHDEDGDDNSPHGYFFLWTHETEKLRVTMIWEKLKITDELVLDEHPRPILGDCGSHSSSNPEIQLGDDFPYKEAQFEIKEFIGDSQVKCVVIESNGNIIVGHTQNFSREFVRDRLLVNY
jgi:hypothetical protein